MKNEQTRANAQAVYDYIIMNPEKHNQAHWAESDSNLFVSYEEVNMCGTTMCVAGTAAYLHTNEETFNSLVRGKAGYHWEDAGQEILGLSDSQAFQLFYTMDNEIALDMINAVAQGDADKFAALRKRYEDERQERMESERS